MKAPAPLSALAALAVSGLTSASPAVAGEGFSRTLARAHIQPRGIVTTTIPALYPMRATARRIARAMAWRAYQNNNPEFYRSEVTPAPPNFFYNPATQTWDIAPVPPGMDYLFDNEAYRWTLTTIQSENEEQDISRDDDGIAP